jgi:hypothetical protein
MSGTPALPFSFPGTHHGGMVTAADLQVVNQRGVGERTELPVVRAHPRVELVKLIEQSREHLTCEYRTAQVG